MRGHQGPPPEATSTETPDLLGRLIAAQETERSRIARHLHDDVSQRIAELSIMISGVKHTLRGKPDEADVTTALTMMQQVIIALDEQSANSPTIYIRVYSIKRGSGYGVGRVLRSLSEATGDRSELPFRRQPRANRG